MDVSIHPNVQADTAESLCGVPLEAHSVSTGEEIAKESGDEVVTAVTPLVSLNRGLHRVDVTAEVSGLYAAVRTQSREFLRVRLGLTVGGRRLANGTEVFRSSERQVAERIEPVSGKTTLPTLRNHDEATISFVERDGFEWSVVLRLAEDGLALRYDIPDLWGVSTLDAEHTAVQLSTWERAWMLDYQTWYETPRFGSAVKELAPGSYGFPALLENAAGGYLLISEAAIDGRYSGAHGVVDQGRQELTFETADVSTEIARGTVTPWRVFVFGDLTAIVETNLVDEVAPGRHASMTDASWVRPGRAAWSWWSDFYSGAQIEHQKHFVDVAAEMGWEHLLIDCGWEETWVPEIVAYASSAGIQVHLWCVWHDLDGPEKISKLALWKSWGVAGIKVDFMESESKDRYRWYDSILQESARLRLMVNFHGSVIPRGWARTWPQVVSYEAIRGSEYYVFYQDTPLTSSHNVIQPFTRNVVGAMDYTPVALKAPGRTTSAAHELAMAVVFESGITHFADDVDVYAAEPAVSRLLQELPSKWDETRLLAGSPDTEAVLARRSGDRWFVGALATGPSRHLSVPLDRLGNDGTFRAWVVTDAGDGGFEESVVSVEKTLEVDIANDGGFAAILVAEAAELFRAEPNQRRRLPWTAAPIVEADESGRAEVHVDEVATLRVPPRWSAKSLGQGRWEVHHPDDLRPGCAGVVMVEVNDGGAVPLFSPVRVFRPFTGEAQLSNLTMIEFRNESGPVERDMSNGGGNPGDGQRLRVGDVQAGTGLGMSSPGHASFHLGGHASHVSGEVGVDNETPNTSAVAIVEADGRGLFRAEIRAGEPPVPFTADLDGAKVLTLRTLPIGEDPAHVDWLSPVLYETRT